MRIIKKGKIKELPKEVEETCDECGCVFAYGKEDVKHGNYVFVTCPFCHERILVDDIWK